MCRPGNRDQPRAAMNRVREPVCCDGRPEHAHECGNHNGFDVFHRNPHSGEISRFRGDASGFRRRVAPASTAHDVFKQPQAPEHGAGCQQDLESDQDLFPKSGPPLSIVLFFWSDLCLSHAVLLAAIA
jgi:hypothetical protein